MDWRKWHDQVVLFVLLVGSGAVSGFGLIALVCLIAGEWGWAWTATKFALMGVGMLAVGFWALMLTFPPHTRPRQVWELFKEDIE